MLPLLEEEARERQGKRNDLTSVKELTQVEKVIEATETLRDESTSVKKIPEVKIPQRATEQAAKITGTNRQYILMQIFILKYPCACISTKPRI